MTPPGAGVALNVAFAPGFHVLRSFGPEPPAPRHPVTPLPPAPGPMPPVLPPGPGVMVPAVLLVAVLIAEASMTACTSTALAATTRSGREPVTRTADCAIQAPASSTAWLAP